MSCATELCGSAAGYRPLYNDSYFVADAHLRGRLAMPSGYGEQSNWVLDSSAEHVEASTEAVIVD